MRLARLSTRLRGGSRTDGPIDRASSEDLVSLATDVGDAPMQVGAVLVLETDAEFEPERAVDALATRIAAVPRLRQCLVATPPGCGRPVWIDDPRFDIGHHVDRVACPAPGDERALLAVAADVVGTRLPSDRPLWRLAVVSGLEGDRTALVVAFHHVLADGIGGLAVLANLVDGAPPPAVRSDRPRPAPAALRLARDAWHERLVRLAELPASLARVRAAITQLSPTARSRAARCSLNRPTGAERRFAVARVALDDLHRCAREHGATVNDLVLTAVAAALRSLLAARGESVDRFVISVPVSARERADPTTLGNRVGVVPVEVPATGPADERIRAVAATTAAARGASRIETTALLGPVFRLLARLGLFLWFIDRQRLVHTFVTNLRGPDARLTFLDRPVVDAVALAVVTGNVTVSTAVLSYAGTVAVTVIADPVACPEVDALRDAVQHELDGLIAA